MKKLKQVKFILCHRYLHHYTTLICEMFLSFLDYNLIGANINKTCNGPSEPQRATSLRECAHECNSVSHMFGYGDCNQEQSCTCKCYTESHMGANGAQCTEGQTSDSGMNLYNFVDGKIIFRLKSFMLDVIEISFLSAH